MASFKIIVWDSGAKVVDVVIAYVSCEPLQNLREFVKRAAFNSRSGIVPGFMFLPINALILMLDIE
jgi:hypothetical protein